jgi:uncharacterized protein (UPF0548 family)
MATAARWPVGVALTSWRYMWRTTPIKRSEEQGWWPEDSPPPLPDGLVDEDAQLLRHGVGALFHRRYRARIRSPEISSEELMARLQRNPDRAAPSEFATFKKSAGDEDRMRPGDEWVVRMPGPWDGPVRVVDVSPRSFRLMTLGGHLEAGQIAFRVEGGGDRIGFEIESWARSGDRLSDLLYDRLRMSKEIQLHMWTSFLERVIRLSGGTRNGPLRIETRRVEVLPPDSASELGEIRAREVNFDLTRVAEYTPENGWNVDDVRTALPSEPAGDPVPGGSWETARRIARTYDFADRSIVEGIFDPDEPLEDRTMLLILHFHGLRIRVGVRVGEVYDEPRELDGRSGRVFGWNYRTLTGHVERGQMDWQVWKFPDSGEVLFRIHSFSRPAGRGNVLLRISFRLVGRREQLRFLKLTSERMARLTEERMGRPASGSPPTVKVQEAWDQMPGRAALRTSAASRRRRRRRPYPWLRQSW